MKSIITYFLLMLVFCFTVSGQSVPKKLSLIILKCKSGASSCHTQEIVKYNFHNGEYVSNENLLSIDTAIGRFDFGNSFYKNQYIISDSGTFFDIKNKKILGDDRGWVKDVIGDEIILEVDNNNYESGIFKFNLKTNKYEKIQSPNIFELDGILSPDKSKFVTWKNGLGRTTFTFYKVSEDFKYTIHKNLEGSFDAYCSIRCSSAMEVPFVWLNNDKIITQRKNGKIISINTDGFIEDIVDLNLNIEDVPDSLPSLSKDEFGNIDYYINGETYSISVNDKSFEKDKSELGNNFYLIKNDFPIWTSYFYDNKSIGRFGSYGGVTRKGFLATYYLEKNNNSGFYDGAQYWNEGGIMIWNDIKKDWIKIEVDWGVKIIGWLEE